MNGISIVWYVSAIVANTAVVAASLYAAFLGTVLFIEKRRGRRR